MRRFLLMSLFVCIAYIANAQVKFVPYEPVIVGPNGERVQQQQQRRQENFQTVNAYFVNRQGNFEKLRLKVNVVQGLYGSTSVYVRGYYDKNSNYWYNMNSRASEVDVMDADVIKENFDYKFYIQGYGYVYF